MSSNDMIPPPLTPQTKWLTLVEQVADCILKEEPDTSGVETLNIDWHHDWVHDHDDPACMAYWLRKDVERELERRRR